MTPEKKKMLLHGAACILASITCGLLILWLPPWWRLIYQFAVTASAASIFAWTIRRVLKIRREALANLDASKQHLEHAKQILAAVREVTGEADNQDPANTIH